MIWNIYYYCLKYDFKFPRFFYHILTVIKFYLNNKLKLIYRTNNEFNWSKSFLPYLYNTKEQILKWFNQYDQDTINILLAKIEYIWTHNLLQYDKVFSLQEELQKKDFLKYYFSIDKNSFFKSIECANLLYYMPLTIQEIAIDKNLKWDILDCGAYIWDSSIIFSDIFPDANIYAFEPNNQNYNILTQNIVKFNKLEKIIPVNKWLWEKESICYMNWNWAWSSITNEINSNKIEITSIDNFINKHNLNPKIIKRDIEWAEYNSILGTIETLKKFKPILFISIYHTGKDFFEIKPFIENLNLWYKFKIARWNYISAFADTILVCY